jgi:uncharacterized membrane protein
VNYTVSVDIRASADRVWAELIDVERWPEWTPSMRRVERLDDDPFGVSSRARVTQPKLAPLVWTVSEFAPGRSFTWTARAAGMTIVAEHRLSPGPGQAVTVTLALRQSGALVPVVSLFTAGLTRRHMNQEAQGLKRRCEEEGRVPL